VVSGIPFFVWLTIGSPATRSSTLPSHLLEALPLDCFDGFPRFFPVLIGSATFTNKPPQLGSFFFHGVICSRSPRKHYPPPAALLFEGRPFRLDDNVQSVSFLHITFPALASLSPGPNFTRTFVSLLSIPTVPFWFTLRDTAY